MDISPSRLLGRALVAVLAIVGGIVGLFVGYSHRLPGQPTHGVIHDYPLPHHIPKYPGGVSLRFAMVHDVIHERFPRHGEAYYQERNRRARETLAARKGPPDEAAFALMDDLGAGFDFLKQDDEAVSLLREKLRQQEAAGLKERQLYTSYANLGTFLIHGSARAGLAGDPAARERMREGLEFLRKAIVVNPEAHFGREVWQVAAVVFLLAASEDPTLLLRYDMIGDRLDEDLDPSSARSFTAMYGMMQNDQHVADYVQGEDDSHRAKWGQWLREQNITPVGAEPGRKEAVPFTCHDPVPFDEPTLGIIGRWRLGGGASPQFALALGEIMLRVGQRYIAWCAYERAALLAGRVWPDADIQRQFAEHCRRRQELITRQLRPEEVQALRPGFEAELVFGQVYQKEYQTYEAERIGVGASLDDEHFYDAFHATHPPIASPVGPEEKFVAEYVSPMPFMNWGVAVFAAGVAACLGAVGVRLVRRR